MSSLQRFRLRQVAAGGAASALSLALLGAPAAATAGALSWAPCANGFQCATMSVPLDYKRPEGAQISIAVTRLPATDPQRRIGSLVINPGGPGVAGVAFAQTYLADLPAGLRARFDVVSFDPRGVGTSTALRCYDTGAQAQADRPSFPYPETPAEEQTWHEADLKLTAACRQHAGPILGHMATADVARDLDRLRDRLGDRKLTYLGYSYGTLLGQTYANLFPGSFRALVLDAVINPVIYTQRVAVVGRTPADNGRLAVSQSSEQTLHEFFRVCDAAGSACAFSGQSAARFAWLAARLEEQPATIVDPGTQKTTTLTYNVFVSQALTAMFYPVVSWRSYASYLADVERQIRPGRSRTSAAEPLETSAAQENYPNTVEAPVGIACSDTVNPRSFETWRAAADRAARQYPYFGRIYSWLWSACGSWPLSATQDSYHGPWTARTAATVLIVGNYFDPATPYSAAVTASRLLPNSRLLSYAGWGHVAFHLQGNACVDADVTDYLLTARPPAPGTVCQAISPFPAAAH